MSEATLTSSPPPSPPPPAPPPQAASVAINNAARKSSGTTRQNIPLAIETIETPFSVSGGTSAGRGPETWFLERQYSYATFRGQASGRRPCYGAALPVDSVL